VRCSREQAFRGAEQLKTWQWQSQHLNRAMEGVVAENKGAGVQAARRHPKRWQNSGKTLDIQEAITTLSRDVRRCSQAGRRTSTAKDDNGSAKVGERTSKRPSESGRRPARTISLVAIAPSSVCSRTCRERALRCSKRHHRAKQCLRCVRCKTDRHQQTR
jgi:hypothetical protein